jgi:hypothetical protein
MSASPPSPYMPARRCGQLVRADGTGPFISRIVQRLPDGSFYTWTSRHYRKGSGLGRRVRVAVAQAERRINPWLDVWIPAELGWWISVLFMVGSACFALASFAGLEPDALIFCTMETSHLPTTGTSLHWIGYARVSSVGQNLDSQMNALHKAGCSKIFTDKMNGSRLDRPGWDQMMVYVRPGDTLVVTELSRLTPSGIQESRG